MLKCEKNKLLSKRGIPTYSLIHEGKTVGVVYSEENHWYLDSWDNNFIHWQCSGISEARKRLEGIYEN